MINYYPLRILLFSVVFLWSCGSSNPDVIIQENVDTTLSTAEGDESNPSTNNEKDAYLSKLSDLYSTQVNTIPVEFERLQIEKEVVVDLTKGYRIQIYSGQDLAQADSIAKHFRAWSETTITGYQAETYTFFKPPNYRVHIGDFHNKDRALSFSRIVKRAFNEAWVVYDNVNPFRVLADSTEITIQTP